MTSSVVALLIMPDDRRPVLLEQLEKSGTEVLSVCNCDQARRVLQTRPVQVVLTDVALSDGNWWSVLEDIAQSHTNAELILCTGIAEPTLWCDALDRGAYDLLVEPYEREEVERIVKGAAARSRLRSTAAAS